MNWDNIRFTARDMLMIIVNVVTATSFILIMKGDIRTLVNGQQRMEAKQDKSEDDNTSFRAKCQVELTELKVRISIVEQKVNNIEIEQNAIKSIK